MKVYEGLLIYPAEVQSEDAKSPMDNFNAHLEKVGGKVDHAQDMGRRSIGYAINKIKQGHFYAIDFTIDPAKLTELRRALQLDTGILKYSIFRKDLVAVKPKKAAKPRVAAKAAAPAPKQEKAAESAPEAAKEAATETVATESSEG